MPNTSASAHALTLRALMLGVGLGGLAACSVRSTAPAEALIDGKEPAITTVAERYVTQAVDGQELDSLATWTSPARPIWLIASGKSSNRLLVFDADSGKHLRDVGGSGKAPGQFDRPNGLAVVDDALFVVERDNHRIQVLHLPDFTPLAAFGAETLRSPYGIWLYRSAPGVLQAYVTDSFMYGETFDVVPPLAELSQRIRRFELRQSGDRFSAAVRGSFGATTEDGALRVVESLAGDANNDRLLIADESTAAGRHGSNLREYTLGGRYTGRSLPEGSFQAEAEGVALWTCGNGRGYWIAVDQLRPLTRFHLFQRDTLALRGSFSGTRTADTDGIALHLRPTAAFPGGALFAVDRDRAIAAFDLREVARALRLEADCTQ